MALITAAQARLVLTALTGTVEDTNLDTLIAAIGAAFARWCGYPPSSAGGNPTLESATYTRYLTGRGGRDLALDVWPVTSITSIQDDSTLDFDGSTYLVGATDYAIQDGEHGVVRLTSAAAHGSWSTGKGQIKAVFVAGFATVPNDLAFAARLAVKNIYELRNRQGKSSSSMGETSESFRDEELLPTSVRALLGGYRLPRRFL